MSPASLAKAWGHVATPRMMCRWDDSGIGDGDINRSSRDPETVGTRCAGTDDRTRNGRLSMDSLLGCSASPTISCGSFPRARVADRPIDVDEGPRVGGRVQLAARPELPDADHRGRIRLPERPTARAHDEPDEPALRSPPFIHVPARGERHIHPRGLRLRSRPLQVRHVSRSPSRTGGDRRPDRPSSNSSGQYIETCCRWCSPPRRASHPGRSCSTPSTGRRPPHRSTCNSPPPQGSGIRGCPESGKVVDLKAPQLAS